MVVVTIIEVVVLMALGGSENWAESDALGTIRVVRVLCTEKKSNKSGGA